ncbi:MAG: LD-carboxypeptidase [Acidobacteriota bacterium]
MVTSGFDHPRAYDPRARHPPSDRAIATLPPPVRPGDRVGVAALSGPVDPARLARGLAALRALGFEVVEAANLRSRDGLFAGADAERLRAFHDLADRDDVGAIFFARGGYGVHRLLPHFDWPRLARHPRAYIGYSDLTPFLLQVVARLGCIAFHGPMVAADLARGLRDDERTSLLDALAGRLPSTVPLAGRIDGGCERAPATSGPLLGGCLSLLAGLLGTPYAPDLRGAWLLLEEVSEPRYRLDRMLTHLRLSGTLANLRGIVFGHAIAYDEGQLTCASDAIADPARPWLDCLDALAPDPVPVYWGIPAGHAAPNWTLPLGSIVRPTSTGDALHLGDPELHSSDG